MMQYVRYPTSRRPEEYQGQSGREVGGLALPAYVYAAIAASKVRDLPPPYAVLGEWRNGEARWLDFGVTAAYIEATTHYRAAEAGVLRWTCPDCGRLGGKHNRTCGYE